MTVTIIGMEKLIKNFSSYQGKMLDAIVDGTTLTQAQMVNHARANHAQDAHARGRFVSHHGAGGLVGSIQPGAVVITDEKVTAEVVTRSPYGGYVEYGTKTAKRYPFLEPARKASEKPLVSNIKRLMGRVKP